jgi:hypothetical protein
MARRLSILLAGLWAVTPAFAAEAQPQPQQGHEIPAPHFHPPAIEAERALNRILVRGDRESDRLLNQNPKRGDRVDRMFYFMTGREGGRKKYGSLFAADFSREVIDSIAGLERKWVKEDCNGKYRNDEICGFDYNPLNCAQDSPPYGYFFAVETQGDGQAVIAVSWGENDTLAGRYRMVERKGHWKIDAIDCSEGDKYPLNKFNW